jgi:hypothetical protein
MAAPDIEPASLQINRSHTATPCSLATPPHEIVSELSGDDHTQSRRYFSSREQESNDSSNDTTYFSDHVTHSDQDVSSEVVGDSHEADADEVKSRDNSQPTLSPIDLSTSTNDASIRDISPHRKQTFALETAKNDGERSRQPTTGSKSLYHSIQELSLPSNACRKSEPDRTFVASGATEFNSYFYGARTVPINGRGYNGGDLDTSFREETDSVRAAHSFKDYQDYNENFDGRNNAAKCSTRSENADAIYPGYSGSYLKDSHFHHRVPSVGDFENREAMHPHVEQASFWTKVAEADDTPADVRDGGVLARRYSALHMTKTDDDDGVLAKRARMENIVNSLRASSPQQRTSSPPLSSDADDLRCLKRDTAQSSPTHVSVMTSIGEWDATTRRSKRKRYVPQQHDGWRTDDALMKSVPSMDDVRSDDDAMTEKSTAAAALLRAETISVREQLQTIEDRLSEMHTKCLMSFTADLPQTNVVDEELRVATTGDLETDHQRNGMRKTRVEASTPEVESRTTMMTSLPLDERLIKLLKAEIDRSVGTLIDNVVRAFVDRYVASRSQRQQRETSRDQQSTNNSNNNSEITEERQAKNRSFSTDLTSHSLLRHRTNEMHPTPPVGALPMPSLPAALLAAAPAIPFPFPVDVDDHLGRSLLAERLQSAMCGHALDSRSATSTGLNFSLPRAMASGAGRDTQSSRSAVNQPSQVVLPAPNEFAAATHMSSAGRYTPQQQQQHQTTHRFYRRVSQCLLLKCCMFFKCNGRRASTRL